MAPPEIKELLLSIVSHEIKTHNQSDSSAEGYDYRLEELNKLFKQFLCCDFPTFSDWLTTCDNGRHWKKLLENIKKDYGLSNSDLETYAPDYEGKINHCRRMLRSTNTLNYGKKCKAKNINGVKVNNEDLSFVQNASCKKETYLDNICDAGSFVKAKNP